MDIADGGPRPSVPRLSGAALRHLLVPMRVVIRAAAALLHVYRPALKRSIDLVGAALLLILVAPAFVLVFLLVRAEGGGPVLVARRQVVGRGGREFGLLAFRAPEEAGGQRPNRLGRALRRTALDEVPRLLNVLRGDMSLVGPRPVTRQELERAYALFGGATAYLLVRPGLTGPCQACARGGLGARERIALDVAYARRPSLRADLAILARTLGMVPRRPEAR
jgi:exopolysaccharide production protein ExoY